MPNYTNYYSLIKPKKGENYDVDETTGKNMDIIDTELHRKVEKQPGKGLSSNDFTDGYKNKIDTLSSVRRYKGSKNSFEELQQKGNRAGDVWNVVSEGKAYAWNGEEWEDIGSNIDFTVLVTKEELNDVLNTIKAKTIPTRWYSWTSIMQENR